MTATVAPPAPAPAQRAQPTRRGAELGLLVFGWLVGALALATVGWGTGAGLPTWFFQAVAVTAGAGLIAHAAVRTRAPYADPIMLPVAYTLNLLGLVMIYRLDVAAEERARANGSPMPTSDAFNQLIWTMLGIALFVAVLLAVRDHRRLQRYTYVSLIGGVGLLLLPLLPGIGTTINGARLWIAIGPFTFQPGELAKIVLTIFLAGYLVLHRDSLAMARHRILGLSLPRGRDLGPLAAAWLLALAVMGLETDLGTALIFYGVFVAMVYVATARRGWIILGALLFAAGAVFAYNAFAHVRTRVAIWLDPFAVANDAGYQIVQSLYGLANGGVLGTGWGQGYPQLVPFANSDFILSAFGEELGLAGLMPILLMYAIMVQRGLRTAVAARDGFGRLLATGLSVVFALQVFVVAGGVTRLIPMTGLVTPFLSAGGSALISNWIMVALLLRISDITRRPDPVVTTSDDSVTPAVRL